MASPAAARIKAPFSPLAPVRWANGTLARFFTPGVRQIILIKIAAYLTIRLLSVVLPYWQVLMYEDYFALNPLYSFPVFFVWQFVTYLFIHFDALNLFFNILTLWVFGQDLEIRWGYSRFMRFFLSVGILAGMLQQVITMATHLEPWPIVGASAPLWGIILAYVSYYPNRVVLFSGAIPLMMKYLVPTLVVLVYILSFRRSDGHSSFFIPLGGLIISYIYLSNFHRTWDLRQWRYSV